MILQGIVMSFTAVICLFSKLCKLGVTSSLEVSSTELFYKHFNLPEKVSVFKSVPEWSLKKETRWVMESVLETSSTISIVKLDKYIECESSSKSKVCFPSIMFENDGNACLRM